MKLDPLAPARLVQNIRRISRKLKIKVITQEEVKLSELIIIGNGTPDDIAIAIISHHLDGERPVGIVKPERTGLGVFELLPRYLELMVDKYLILMDQDDNSLNDLFDDVTRS